MSWGQTFLPGQALSQVKSSPEHGAFSGSCQAGQLVRVRWGWVFSELQTHYGCWAAGCLSHYSSENDCFQSYGGYCESRMGIVKVIVPQNLLPLSRFHRVSSLNPPQILTSLWLISRLLKRWFWPFLPVFSLFLCICRSPYSKVSKMFSLWLFIYKLITLNEIMWEIQFLTHTH